MFKHHMKPAGWLLVLAALACLPLIFAAQRRKPEGARAAPLQDFESRLSQKADFIPNNESTVDQLVAVAQHYQIPMGIEWIKPAGSRELDVPIPALGSSATVRDLLRAIVLRLPDYQMTVQNGIVHVAPPVFAVDTDNFLNVLIEEFKVENENLFAAQHQLRLSIDMTLHPDEYEGGYAGGYGNDPDHVFAKHKLTFTSDDLTVREILDGLVKASGNALWIAEFDPDDFKAAAKSSAKTTKKNGQDETKSKYQWRFLPLIEESARRP